MFRENIGPAGKIRYKQRLRVQRLEPLKFGVFVQNITSFRICIHVHDVYKEKLRFSQRFWTRHCFCNCTRNWTCVSRLKFFLLPVMYICFYFSGLVFVSLGIGHDEDNGCVRASSGGSNIMVKRIYSTSSNYQWSSCSKRMLRQNLR